MKHFTPKEFNGWFDKLSPELKIRLDVLRGVLGVPIILSKSDAAMGRHLGKDNLSQHNVDKWGEVRAVDGYVPDDVNIKDFYDTCVSVGFTGIGLYKGWSHKYGFHVDVREDRKPKMPATWGGIYSAETGKTTYVGIHQILGS